MSGGVSYNVRLVNAVARHFQLPVHVPASPGDAGLSLGYLHALLRPPLPPLEHPPLYSGPLLSGLPVSDVTKGGTHRAESPSGLGLESRDTVVDSMKSSFPF